MPKNILQARRTLTSAMTKTTLAAKPKTSTFTQYLDPDERVPDVETARNPETATPLLHTARLLKSGAFTYCEPEKRKGYRFLAASPNALKDLGLSVDEPLNPEFQQLVSGQKLAENPYPYSQAYAGWQFGVFAGQLGDGRVVNLFEIEGKDQRYEVQLKGSGKTPFSRFADGKAVLRSSIREFLISESLNAIGIPTTRALSLSYLPKTFAQRSRAETCAVVCRFAPSWIRIGTFDLYHWRGDRKGMFNLANYVIEEVFHGENQLVQESKYRESFSSIGEFTKYDKMYLEIVKRNAQTVAKWKAYGFLNGVLNTDNTSILGLSIDFGPFAFMDKFDPNYTSNHDDVSLMYSYLNMSSAIWWNLTRLGEDVAELIGAGDEIVKHPVFQEKGIKKEWEDKIIKRATDVIELAGKEYQDTFMDTFIQAFGKRVGLCDCTKEDYDDLIAPMLEMLEKSKLDFNNFFLQLQVAKLESTDLNYLAQSFIPESYDENEINYIPKDEAVEKIEQWLQKFRSALVAKRVSDEERLSVASQVNPKFIPRGWILEEVVEQAEDSRCEDISLLEKAIKMSTNPFDESMWGDELKDVEKKWTQSADSEKSMLQCSCSS